MEDEVFLGVELAEGVQLFGVMDGHSGRRAVERLVTWLPEALKAAVGEDTSGSWPRVSPESITKVMHAVDARLLADSEANGGWDDGATALLALTLDTMPRPPLQLVQIGDSQAVMCGAMGVEALCAQHRVGDADEDARLAAVGAKTDDGRLEGNGRGVAVTRSLGDLSLIHI